MIPAWVERYFRAGWAGADAAMQITAPEMSVMTDSERAGLYERSRRMQSATMSAAESDWQWAAWRAWKAVRHVLGATPEMRRHAADELAQACQTLVMLAAAEERPPEPVDENIPPPDDGVAHFSEDHSRWR